MMSKKSQGLSINTIILILLGLIIFSILIYIFYNTSKNYNSVTDGAPGQLKDSLCSSFGRCLPDGGIAPYIIPVAPEPQGGWIDCSPPKKCYS
ncbi:hypothetical protein HY483_00005 [Candidatus Woesearchaeota archaeon]|nr:hypothetical protein [Candidatus Woesearchaeota archaeon]